MNKNIMSILLLSIFLVTISQSLGYSIYYNQFGDSKLYQYDTDLGVQISVLNTLSNTNAICSNNDGTFNIITQGNNTNYPDINRFYENGVDYPYLPNALNHQCTNANNIIGIVSKIKLPSTALTTNISIWNGVNGDYKMFNTGIEDSYICANDNSSIIAFGYLGGIGIIKDFTNTSTIEVHATNGLTANTIKNCEIINNKLYLINGTKIVYTNITAIANDTYSFQNLVSYQAISNIKKNGNVLYVVTNNSINYDDVTDNVFTNNTMSITNACTNTLYDGYKNSSCYDVSNDGLFSATIKNNTIWISINNDDFFNLNLSATSLSVFGTSNGSSTNIPLCVDSQTICNSPSYLGGGLYCTTENIEFCSDGCINLVLDNTTNTSYASTFSSCDTLYNDKEKNTGLYFSCTDMDNTWYNYVIQATTGGFINSVKTDCGIFYDSTDKFSIPYSECTDTDINVLTSNNPTHTFLTNGICKQALCTNECNIVGATECSSANTFKVCGNYDTDACLEYNDGYGCMLGELCNNGVCYEPVYSDDITNNTAFTVTPYSTNDDNTEYNLEANKKKITIASKNFIHIQKFATSTSNNQTYTSRTCDYKETNIYTNSQVKNINATETNTFTSSLGVSGIVNINFIPRDLIETNVILYDSVNDVVDNISVLRNTSAKSVSIYTSNQTLLYSDYSVNTYDDLKALNITYTFDKSSNTFTREITFDRLQDISIATKPQIFTTNDIAKISLVTTNATLNSVSVNTITQPTSFALTLRNNYEFAKCTYSKVGCYNVRTYNTNDKLPDFTNKYDYLVCVSGLGLNDVTGQTTNGDNTGQDLSSTTKALIVLIGVFVVFGSFVVVGFATQTIKMSTIVGVIACTLGIIVATLYGWIPAWIMIMLLVVALATIILLSSFKPQATG